VLCGSLNLNFFRQVLRRVRAKYVKHMLRPGQMLSAGRAWSMGTSEKNRC